MTAPRKQSDPGAGPRVLKLPDLDDRKIPGWRFTRHVVGITLGIFALLALVGLIVASVLTVRVTVTAPGVLEPAAVWQVRSLEGGILSQVLVRTGDSVRAGQVVARLDSTSLTATAVGLEAELATARITLTRASRSVPVESARSRAAVDAAIARLTRARVALRQRMAEFGVDGNLDSVVAAAAVRVHVGFDAPAADVRAAEAEVAAARAQFASSELSTFDVSQRQADIDRLVSLVAMARQRLARLAVVAPASGLVLTDRAEYLPGSAIAAGQTILEIGDVREWRAVLGAAERDVHRIRLGDTAEIRIPAFTSLSSDRFTGRVASVGWQPVQGAEGLPAGSLASRGEYRVIVSLNSAELAPLNQGALRYGYAVQGKIITRSQRALRLLVEKFREKARDLR